MTLSEVLEALPTMEAGKAIYAAQPEGYWTLLSPAMVADEPSNGDLSPLTVDGEPYEYVTDAASAKDAIANWSQWRGGRAPTVEDKLAAVIYYAEYDGYLPIA